MSEQLEPLSDFARKMLREIGLRQVETTKVPPALRHLFARRLLVAPKKIGLKWFYELTPAGKAEAGLDA